MSIDTAAKRYSAMDAGNQIWAGAPLPTGSIDASARAHLSALYTGISAVVTASTGAPTMARIVSVGRLMTR